VSEQTAQFGVIRRMRTSSFLLLVASTACYPAVAHPTRVSSGFSVTTTLGAHLTRDEVVTSGTFERNVTPTFGISAAVSIRDTSSMDDGPGFRLSVGTGFAMPIWQAYMELPRDRFGPYDAGIGVAYHSARPRLVMPYAQFGRELGRSWSWYTQQGIGFGSTSDGESSGLIWLPTVAVSAGLGGSASLFMTGVVGGKSSIYEEICGNCAEDPRRVQRSILVMGFSWGQLVVSNIPVPR
jgi:hypothetical protein